LATQKEIGSRRAENIAVPSEWERNETKLLRNTGHTYRNVKRDTHITERKILPPFLGLLVDRSVLLSYPSGKGLIFSNKIRIGEIAESKEL
jgi:hypothetical protein